MLSEDVRVCGIRTNKSKKDQLHAEMECVWRFRRQSPRRSPPGAARATRRRGEPFDDETGLPESEMGHRLTGVSFYTHAIEFMDMRSLVCSCRRRATALRDVRQDVIPDP